MQQKIMLLRVLHCIQKSLKITEDQQVMSAPRATSGMVSPPDPPFRCQYPTPTLLSFVVSSNACNSTRQLLATRDVSSRNKISAYFDEEECGSGTEQEVSDTSPQCAVSSDWNDLSRRPCEMTFIGG